MEFARDLFQNSLIHNNTCRYFQGLIAEHRSIEDWIFSGGGGGLIAELRRIEDWQIHYILIHYIPINILKIGKPKIS